DDDRELCGGGFEDGVGCSGGGHKDDADVRTSLTDGVVDGGEDGNAHLFFAAAPRVDGRDHVGAVVNRAAHVVLALGADALHQQASVFVEKDAHRGSRE